MLNVKILPNQCFRDIDHAQTLSLDSQLKSIRHSVLRKIVIPVERKRLSDLDYNKRSSRLLPLAL